MRIRICEVNAEYRCSGVRYETGAHHADEESWLLSSTPHTGVTDDTDSETCRETSETDGETGAELHVALEERHPHLD